jgi:hypothetical protein
MVAKSLEKSHEFFFLRTTKRERPPVQEPVGHNGRSDACPLDLSGRRSALENTPPADRLRNWDKLARTLGSSNLPSAFIYYSPVFLLVTELFVFMNPKPVEYNTALGWLPLDGALGMPPVG